MTQNTVQVMIEWFKSSIKKMSKQPRKLSSKDNILITLAKWQKKTTQTNEKKLNGSPINKPLCMWYKSVWLLWLTTKQNQLNQSKLCAYYRQKEAHCLKSKMGFLTKKLFTNNNHKNHKNRIIKKLHTWRQQSPLLLCHSFIRKKCWMKRWLHFLWVKVQVFDAHRIKFNQEFLLSERRHYLQVTTRNDTTWLLAVGESNKKSGICWKS